MVIQELITAIATECKLALNLWYLDDGVLAGSAAQVHVIRHSCSFSGWARSWGWSSTWARQSW